MEDRLRTVVLIDDEIVDRMLHRRAIERSGVVDQVVEFDSAAAALAWLGDGRPSVDLIFLDINMPGMGGLDFLEAATARLGERFADGVVIMLTTSLAPTDVLRARSFPVVRDYLDKPLRPEDVVSMARMVRELREVG